MSYLSNQSVSVRILIDTSTASAGLDKLDEICTIVRQVVGNSPDVAQFDVSIFNAGYKKLFSDQKSTLDLNALINDINRNCGSTSIALYDGLGQTLNEIPYDPTSGFSSLLVFSVGQDNISTIYNAQSVVNLLNEKLTRNTNMHLTFIQFGRQSAITSAIQANSNARARCSLALIPINSSGHALKLLLNSATQCLCTQLNKLNRQRPERQKMGPWGSTPTVLAAVRPPGFTAVVQPQPQQAMHNLIAHVANRRRNQKCAQRQQPVNSFKVWVGNIPMVGQPEILDYLKQWGPCHIETINGNPSQWAVVAYTTQQAMEFAVKYGNGSKFKGQTININKIT